VPAEKENKRKRKPIFCRHYAEPFWVCISPRKKMGDTTFTALLRLLRGHNQAGASTFYTHLNALHMSLALFRTGFDARDHKNSLPQKHLLNFTALYCTFKEQLL